MLSTLRGSSRALSRNSVRSSLPQFRRQALHNAFPKSAVAAVKVTVDSTSYESFFPNEPSGPSVKTEIPGPKSKVAIAELDEVFDTRSLNMICDYEKSVGN